jgi:hypothetical protein
MDAHRHKTQKRSGIEIDINNNNLNNNNVNNSENTFKALLEDSAREAYSRPWHRIERGLRLNRLRLYIEEISLIHNMTKDEKDGLFIFLQKAHDKKLLNTLKVVNYDQNTQRITAIRGLEIKRNQEGILKWGFSLKKSRTDITRKKKRSDETTVDETQ